MVKKVILVVAMFALIALLLSGLPPQWAEASPTAETEWVHHKWEQSGRTLYNPDTGQYKYVSYIGQTNVDLGDGNYAPYVWNPVTKVAKFADCQLRFFNPHFEFWRNGSKLTTAKFQLLKKVGTDWVNIPVFFDGLTVNEGDEFATAILKLKDENNNEVIANIRFGLFHYIVLDFEVKVNAEGEYRLEMENAGLSGDVREIHSGTGIKGLEEREDRVIGVVYEKMRFGWSYDEAPDRLYLHQVEADGSETSRKIVELGNLFPSESKLISPDQWGPTAIVHDADDGEEDGRLFGTHAWKTDGYYQVGENKGFFGYFETYDSPFEPGLRWDNITCSGAAQDGCKIELDFICAGHMGSAEGDYMTTGGYLHALDEADPGAFDSAVSSTWPSNRSRTTANVSWNMGYKCGWDNSPEIKTIIQELIDSYTYTGTQAMAFYWREDDDEYTQATYTMFGLYGHATAGAAQLTIVYTPPTVGGEVYPINKVTVLMPWIGPLAVLLALGAGLVAMRRRQAH